MAENRELNIVINAKDNASKTIKTFADRFSDLVEQSKVASAAFAGALTLVGKRVVDVASDMEQTKVSFTTFLGSSDAASKSLKELSDFAKTTPFEMPQVLEASKRLLAYNIEAKDLIPTLQMLGDISAGVGMDKLPQLILAFGQVKAATRLTGMELRQFSEAGVPLLDALAKQAGVTAAQMTEMITDKAVGFDQVQKALSGMTGEGGKFFNLMENQSKTLKGRMSNISDQLVRVALSIAGISTEAETFGNIIEGGMFDRISLMAQRVLDVLNELEPKIQGFITSFLSNSQAIFLAVGLLTGALTGVAVATWAIFAPFIALTSIGGLLALGVWRIYENFRLLMESLPAIQGMLMTVGEGIMVFINTAIEMFRNLPTTVGQMLYQFFVVDVPYMWGFLAAYLYTAVPSLIFNIIMNFTKLYQESVLWWNATKEAAIQKLKDLWAYVAKEVPTWPDRFKAYIQSLPLKVQLVLDDMYFAFNAGLERIWGIVKSITDKIRSAFDAITSAVNGAIDAIKRGIQAGISAGSNFKFQHGGFVPGGYGEAVPAILHGGERIIPRTGVDVNPGGGGGANVTINISGSWNLDNSSRVDEMVSKIIETLGRQNELAGLGVGF